VHACQKHDDSVRFVPKSALWTCLTVLTSIVGRAFQGIGGAGLYSLSQICLIELGLGGPETVGAMVGITLSVSYVLGPLLGGVISSSWKWQGIFLIK
jgi:MFS family permease